MNLEDTAFSVRPEEAASERPSRRAAALAQVSYPLRDAAVATLALIAAIALGSGGFASVDTALLGYLGATLVAAFGVAWRISAFWRRPASAFYARALLTGLRRPRTLLRTVEFAGRDLVAQDFIRRRSLARWAAHMLLSLGVMASFAITVPLVFGWMRFEAAGENSYRMIVFTMPAISFAVDGVFAWFLFHGLSIAAVAVVIGAGYFLAARVRVGGFRSSTTNQGANEKQETENRKSKTGQIDQFPVFHFRFPVFHFPFRRGQGVSSSSTSSFAIAPLLLLLLVALTGLALPASRGWPIAFQIAAALHEVSVVVLLVALPFTKLAHVLIRPLQLGARAVRAGGLAQQYCSDCGAALAPAEQLRAVDRLLVARGIAFGMHLDRCQPCRRRQIAGVQAALVGAQFQPHLAARRRPVGAPRQTSNEVA